jgi:3-oxoacyl-[acyl-carrier-protein] synthase II
MSPFFVPMMIANMAAGMVSIQTGAKGPNSTTVTACASSAHAIGDAFEIIRRGAADAMVAGGSEACICRTALGGFCAARALSRRNDDPPHACRPFDRDRDGFVMGEGGTGLILEELELARARGARIMAEVVGYGMSGDAYHMTAPAPGGAGPQAAMRAALQEAQLEPDDVDAISAHGPGTLGGDEEEAAAIQAVFPHYRERPLVTSTKPMHGHQLGAVGATEALTCQLMIEHQFVPGTLNHEHPGEGIELNIVAREAQDARVRVVMSNSFGFGGHNAVLVFKAYDEG